MVFRVEKYQRYYLGNVLYVSREFIFIGRLIIMSQKLKHQWSISHNYMTGITFGKWFRLLADNNFNISPAYWHRAAVISLASISNSIFAAIEKRKFGDKISAVKITKPPVFILGHWRSGTTLLHDLLAQDAAQFQFANTYQVVNPLTFLTTEDFITKMFPGLVPPKRPMDNMALKFSSPQEDEFAPLLMTLQSVYMGISFPKRTEHYEKYLTFKGVPRNDVKKWQDAFVMFCKKLSLNNNRSLLLKSPPHTARIRTILEMFPDARFIHIHRDPYRVFQSQRHFFDTAGWYTYLQRPDLAAIDEGILKRYNRMYDAYFEDHSLIPKGNFCEIKFEDLEKNPIDEIKKVYEQLSLDKYDQFEPELVKYVTSLKGYEKNKFSSLDEPTRKIVANRWKRSFEKWGYDTY